MRQPVFLLPKSGHLLIEPSTPTRIFALFLKARDTPNLEEGITNRGPKGMEVSLDAP